MMAVLFTKGLSLFLTAVPMHHKFFFNVVGAGIQVKELDVLCFIPVILTPYFKDHLCTILNHNLWIMMDVG